METKDVVATEMKNIVSHEQGIGDAGRVEVALGVRETNLRLQVAAEYPLVKVIEPATKALDSTLDKLEKLIPGDWDKPMIEKVKAEYKEELAKLLAAAV